MRAPRRGAAMVTQDPPRAAQIYVPDERKVFEAVKTTISPL